MILYVMEHMVYFSQMLTLRLNVHRDEGAIFAVYKMNVNSEMFKNLRKCDLFDAVFTFAHTGRMAKSESLILDEFQAKHADFIKKIVNCNVKKAYVSYDTFPSFSVLCELLNLNIITIEAFPNHINRLVPSYFEITYKSGNCTEAFFELQKKLAPLDEQSIPIKKIVVFPETKITDNEFVKRYDFRVEFDKVNRADKDKIVQMFCLDNEGFKAEKLSFLLLNNPSAFKNSSVIKSYAQLNSHMYTDEKYSLVYAIVCDYFCDKNYSIVLCPHPYTGRKIDPIKTKLVKLASVEGMPIEYLRYVSDLKIHQLISLYSTATDKLSGLAEHDIILGHKFLSAFFYLDKLYTAGKILSELKVSMHLEYYGIPEGICEYLFDSYNYSVQLNKNILLFESSKAYVINVSLVDFAPLTNSNVLMQALMSAPSDCVVFFTNSLFDYCFVDLDYTDLMEHIIPIVIKRNAITDNPLDEPGESVIYAFAKDAGIKESVKNLHFTKELPFSGIQLVIEPISNSRLEALRQRCYEFAVCKAAINKIDTSCTHNSDEKNLQQSHFLTDEANRKINEMANTIRECEAALKKARQHLYSYESFAAWKLLKPLRFIYRVIKDLRNK